MVEPQTAHLSQKAGLPDLHSPQAIAELAGIPLKKLTWWVWAFPRAKQYRHFEITKRDGSSRHIDAPIPPLKRVQRSLATALTAAYRPPAHVHGFTPSRSPITNAGIHTNQRWIFATDLEDFFLQSPKSASVVFSLPGRSNTPKPSPRCLPGSAAFGGLCLKGLQRPQLFQTTSVAEWTATSGNWQ
jgi:hypothetical protein